MGWVRDGPRHSEMGATQLLGGEGTQCGLLFSKPQLHSDQTLSVTTAGSTASFLSSRLVDPGLKV